MRLTLFCVLLAIARIFQQSDAAAVASPVQQHQTEAAAAAAEPATGVAFFANCGHLGAHWIRYKDACYRYYETENYWYPAELECKRYGGHLVSINDKAENSFVAKLTYCKSAWTGRYAVDLDRLREPSNYRWTDGSSSIGGYHAHDFSTIRSIHDPLISVFNQSWANRVYHSKDTFVCEVKMATQNVPKRCQDGWHYLDGYCYHMPQWTATWIEASFYCSGRQSYLVSVHNETELRALSLLDLTTDGCPPKAWIGLVKINPCRLDMFTGAKICYKWYDRVEDLYQGFPHWHPEGPDTGEVINCVLLEDRAIRTVECHQRQRLICKKKAV